MHLIFGSALLLALTFSPFLWAKGPMLMGTYQGVRGRDATPVSVTFGVFNLPSSTVRIQACDFHFGCENPESLTAYNPFKHRDESYLRNLVFTREEFPLGLWEVDYGYVDHNGRVLPVATLIAENNGALFGPEQITVRLPDGGDEIVLRRVSSGSQE